MSLSYSASAKLRVEFGYCSYLFADAALGTNVRHDNVLVAILAYPNATVEALLPLLERIARSGRPAAFFCAAISADLLNTLIVNDQQRTLRNVAIRAPCVTEPDQASLFSIAAMTGAAIIASPRSLDRITVDMLGEVDSLVVDEISTTLTGFPRLRP